MDEFTTVTAAKLEERRARQQAETSEKEEDVLTFVRYNVPLVVGGGGDIGGGGSEQQRYLSLDVSPSSSSSSSSPALFFIHGLASNKTTFYSSAKNAVKRGLNVAMVDLRGHGESDGTRDGYSLLDMARDVVSVLVWLGEQSSDTCWRVGPVLLVGHSYGGNIALQVAALPSVSLRGVQLAGCVCVDGGYIHLRKKYQEEQTCMLALQPPVLEGVRYEQLREMVSKEWCKGWPPLALQGMLNNFAEQADGTARKRLSFDRHMLLLRDLYAHPPTFLYPLVKIPVLFLPAGEGGPSPFSVSVADDLDEAQAALAKQNGSGVRIEWFRQSPHDIPSLFPSEMMSAIQEATADGFFVGASVSSAAAADAAADGDGDVRGLA